MILTPPLITENPDNKPTVFLAGPIQGAVDWQAEAGKQFEDNSAFHNVVIQSTLKGTVNEAVKILSK